MKIVLAIPTIADRGDAWEEVGEKFQTQTCQPLIVRPAYRPGGWCDGLNEAWEAHPDADVFICGSDDMEPKDANWFPPLLRFLEQGKYPAPKMENHDPVRGYWEYPGTWEPDPVDGTPSKMSTFCVLKGEWLPHVFPLPENFHYYGDDEIARRLRKAGIPCVACPSSVIVHRMESVGRGAGMGSEDVRMAYDREVFESLR